MDSLALTTWTELKTIALWAIKGPRSIVSSPEPNGGASGWVDRMMHWQRYGIRAGLTESRTIFRRPIYEGMSLPSFVLRAATWQHSGDRAATKLNGVSAMSLTVQHFELPESSIDEVLSREDEVHACMAAALACENESDSPGQLHVSDAMYHWHFPGRIVNQKLSWLSSPKTRQLEILWSETLPSVIGLPELNGLFERFECDEFGNYVDVALSQIPTIHQIL